MTCHNSIRPVNASKPNTADWIISPIWLATISLRRGKRSISTPPNKAMGTTGSRAMKLTAPSQKVDSVIW